MFRRKNREPSRSWYIRSPGELLPLFATQPGGSGLAELADDGLRFFVEPVGVRYTTTYLFDETRCRQRHHFSWEAIKGYQIAGLTITVHMTSGGGGYTVAVNPGDGLHRWEHLLPSHGVERLDASG